MEIRRLDLTNDTELHEWQDVLIASIRVVRPRFVPKPYEQQVRVVLDPEPGAERIDLVAIDGDVPGDGTTDLSTDPSADRRRQPKVVGAAYLWLPTEDNLRLAWVSVEVHPDHRRRGIGTALITAAEQALDPSRTEIVCATIVPPGEVADHPYRRFGESVGYSLSTTATARELPWPVDAAALDALDAHTVAPAGYRIETYVDGVPDDYRVSLGVLKGLVDVDAPTGDVEWEASPLSPEHYADELRRAIAAGSHLVETVAVAADGDVVAYTEIEVASVPERPLMQKGTLVRRDHRGHRLGLAVKIANLRHCLAMGLTNPSVRTGNDDANTHMVAINEQLGFVPMESELILAKRR